MKRIIFKNADGGVAILAPDLACGLTIEQIALKDVPAGAPYKIIDTADVPSDRTFRDAWEADMTDAHGIGADYGSGSVNAVVGFMDSGIVVTLPVTTQTIAGQDIEVLDFSAPATLFMDGAIVEGA